MRMIDSSECLKLDCGCVIQPGDDYVYSTCRIWNRLTRQYDKVSISYCYDSYECMGKAYDEKLGLFMYMQSEEITHGEVHHDI